jgi:hypothetical protein
MEQCNMYGRKAGDTKLDDEVGEKSDDDERRSKETREIELACLVELSESV